MADLGKLEVEFDGKTGKLETAGKRAARIIGNVGKSFVGVTSKVVKYTAALNIVSGAISGVFVKKQLDMIDALAKTGDGLGIATEKLQALQHVGQLTGSTTEEINKSLARMERSLGEAARKGGNTALALADLGVSIDDVIKLSPDKQLELLSAALVGVENQSVKASIANDVFGRSGLKMLKLMEELKDKGLAPAVKELDQLGFAISRVDAAKVEAANDSMLRFNKAIEGVFKRLTIQLAPILEGISNEFLIWIKNSGGADKVMSDLVDSMVTGFGMIADAVTVAVRIITKVADSVSFVFNKVSAGFAFLQKKIGQFVHVTDAGQEFLDKFKSKTKSVFDDLPSEKFENFVARVKKSSQEAAEAVAEGVENTKRTGDFTATFFDEKAKTVAASSANELETFRESLRSEEESEIAHYQKRLEELDKFHATKAITEQEAASARLAIEKQHEDALTEIQSSAANERMQLITGSLSTQISNISSAMQLMTGSIGKESKKQFEITKVASIATALVKGYEAVTSAFAFGNKIGGPPVGFAMAATSAAATIAQIQSIRSQQFGGGGSVNASSGGSSSSGATAGGQAEQGEQQRSLHIQGVNPEDLYKGSAINTIIEEINSAVKDGVVLVSSGVQE